MSDFSRNLQTSRKLWVASWLSLLHFALIKSDQRMQRGLSFNTFLIFEDFLKYLFATGWGSLFFGVKNSVSNKVVETFNNRITPWFCLYIFRDELPIKLALPKAIRSAQTNQELTAIALQGQGIVVSVCLCVYLTQSYIYCCGNGLFLCSWQCVFVVAHPGISRGGAPTLKVGVLSYFWPILPQNYIKLNIKKFGTEKGMHVGSKLWSANAFVMWSLTGIKARSSYPNSNCDVYILNLRLGCLVFCFCLLVTALWKLLIGRVQFHNLIMFKTASANDLHLLLCRVLVFSHSTFACNHRDS